LYLAIFGHLSPGFFERTGSRFKSIRDQS